MMTQERKTSTKHGIHLWEFLLDMLADKNCSSVIDWTNKDNGEFKLKNQEEVAKRWGHLKHRPGMNYDKLSRALRYYYQKGIIKKVSGQRLVYRFCNPQVTVDKKHVTAPKIKEEKTESQVEDDCKKLETTREENESNAQPVKCHTGCKVHPYTPSFQSHSDSNFGYALVQTPLVSGGPIGLVPYRYVMPIVIPAHQSVTIIRS